MCFKIDPKAPKWRNLRVYKVVRVLKRTGKRKPQLVSERDPAFRYIAGRYAVAKGNGFDFKSWRVMSGYEGEPDAPRATLHGVYVTKTLRTARAYARNWYNCGSKASAEDYRIIQMAVQPKDHLHTAARGRCYNDCATYKRAKPTGRVWDAYSPWRKVK